MSDQIQNVLIIAAALALVVGLALIFKRQLFIRWGRDRVIKTGGADRPVQTAMATGPSSLIENSTQNIDPGAVATQDLTAKSGGQVKGVQQGVQGPKK